MLVFSATHPILSGGDPLTPEQFGSILLIGISLPTTPAAPAAGLPTAPTTEDDVC
jgi:hypothetical protein